MYILSNTEFDIKELIWMSLYQELHRADMLWVAWRKFDERALITLSQLKRQFGTTIINNWSFGKVSWLGNQLFEYSGARPEIKPIGEKWSKYTQHADWNTFDCKFAKNGKLEHNLKVEAYKDIQKFIINNKQLFPYVKSMEHSKFAPTWLHFSTGNFSHHNGSVRIIKP